jgi:hypothetical protein
MNAGQYRKAIDLAIAIATDANEDGQAPSNVTQMCCFIGALAGAISNGDPALAKRIKQVGQRAIAAGQPAIADADA